MPNVTVIQKIATMLRAAASIAVIATIAGCPGGSASLPAPAYYIDATNGNDANNGLFELSPWKTLGKVSISSFASGTTIYLKRGETWYEQLEVPSSGLSIDAYGSGALPVIDGSFDIGNTGWATEGGTIYSKIVTLAAGEGLGNVSQNGTLLNFVAWNTDFVTTSPNLISGTYTFDYSSNKIYVNVGALPAAPNTYIASKKYYGISAVGKSDISIKNVEVQRFSLHGINLKDCSNCTVSSAVVKQGGGAVISAIPLLYAGNGIECGNSCSNILFDSIAVSDIFDSGISQQTYVSSQAASNITIQNSTVDKAGFAGVEISVLSNSGTSIGGNISNVTVSGLIITNSGKGWSGRRYGTEGHGIRIIADSGSGTMSNILVKDTSISGSIGDGIRLGGEIGTVTINRARIKTNNIGINVASATATSLKLVLTTSLVYANNGYGVSFDVPFGAGFNMYHNTFYNNNAINFGVTHQLGQAKLQNNLFYSSVAMTHFYSATALAGDVVVNNNCYNNQINMFGYNGSTYNTVAEFNAAYALFEPNGYGGGDVNLTTAGELFTLQSDSHCIALGASGLGITLDYALHAYDAVHPSSGAYEFY